MREKGGLAGSPWIGSEGPGLLPGEKGKRTIPLLTQVTIRRSHMQGSLPGGIGGCRGQLRVFLEELRNILYIAVPGRKDKFGNEFIGHV